MTANRLTPTSGTYTGTTYGADVSEEVVALWDRVTNPLSSVSGVNAITAACSPSLTAYTLGQRFSFLAIADNTSAVTVNIDGLGALSLLDVSGEELTAGRLLTGSFYEFAYDGTDCRLLGATAAVDGQNEVALFRYYQANGVAGGASTAGPVQVYPLNDEVYNGISGVSLSSNVITLPIGKYQIDGLATFVGSRGKLLLYNVTTATYFDTVVAVSQGPIAGALDWHIPALLTGVIDITTTTNIRLDYDVITTRGILGLGDDYTGLETDEEYGHLKITKINPFAAASTAVAKLGINTTSDDTQKLVVRSDETQFEALPAADSGTGDRIHYELAEYGGGIAYHVIEEEVTLSGATEDGTKTIPDDAVVLGFSMRVTETVTGATTITAGSTQSATEFGTGIALTAGTTSKTMLNDGLRTASGTVRFTGGGGSFTGGKIRYAVAYLAMQVPTS